MKIKKRGFPFLPVFLVIGGIFALLILFLVIVASRPISNIAGQATSLTNPEKTEIKFAWPKQGRAGIGTLEGGFKSSYGDEEAHPTASLAKIITALVVLEAKPITEESNPIIKMTNEDVTRLQKTISENGSHLKIAEGEELTERQMIEGMMLPSANNIADSLAIWAFGNQENYAATANKWLKEHNLNDTKIGKDASGLDPGTVSTTRDLFELSRLALQNPVLSEIMMEESADFPVAGEVHNTNSLLRDNANYIGLKTGTSEEADACLLFASRQQIGSSETVIIGVLTGQEFGTTFNTARALTKSAVDNLTEYNVYSGTSLATYRASWGASLRAITAEKMNRAIWKDEDPNLEINLQNIALSTKDRAQVGEVEFNGQSSALLLDGAFYSPSLLWRLENLPQLDWL